MSSHCRQSTPFVPTYQSRSCEPRRVNTQTSDAHTCRVGRWDGRAIPPRAIAVAALAVMVLCGHLTAPPAHASNHVADRLIVRYELGAPPSRVNGEPWGAQCVVAPRDRSQLERGRWIGVGMRIVRFRQPITAQRAQRIAREFATCPYIAWAEADLLEWDPPIDP
jgi:hypothetical protein